MSPKPISFSPVMRGPGFANTVLTLGIGLLALMTLTGCAAGNEKYLEDPAGFLAGLWHGLILVVTFIISLFSDGVHVYEGTNTGALYDLGFVLGAAIFFGGSGSSHKIRKKAGRAKEKEWNEFSEKVEGKIRKGIQIWLEESGREDKEWEEIAGKIEEKIKRELRKWAEK